MEAEYFRLQREWQAERFLYAREAAQAGDDQQKLAALAERYPNRGNYVIMPPIPWDPYQNDFWYSEVLNEIEGLMMAGDRAGAERIARRDRLDELADLIYSRRDRCRPRRSDEVADRRSRGSGPQRRHAVADRVGCRSAQSAGFPQAALFRHGFTRTRCGFASALRFPHLDLLCAVPGLFRPGDRHLVGSLQGYLGGRFDIISQRFIEILLSIPFLYVVIILAALMVPTFWTLLAIMAVFQWITITFYMRTEMYREKTKEYCLAAKSYGASHWRIIFRHLLPNCLTPLVTFTPFAIVGRDLRAHRLDYLGYGLPRPRRAGAN